MSQIFCLGDTGLLLITADVLAPANQQFISLSRLLIENSSHDRVFEAILKCHKTGLHPRAFLSTTFQAPTEQLSNLQQSVVFPSLSSKYFHSSPTKQQGHVYHGNYPTPWNHEHLQNNRPLKTEVSSHFLP